MNAPNMAYGKRMDQRRLRPWKWRRPWDEEPDAGGEEGQEDSNWREEDPKWRARQWYADTRPDKALGVTKMHGDRLLRIGDRLKVVVAWVDTVGAVYCHVPGSGLTGSAVLLPWDQHDGLNVPSFKPGMSLRVWVKDFPHVRGGVSLTTHPPRRSASSLEINERLLGRVVGFHENGRSAFVDVGAEGTALLPAREVELLRRETIQDKLKVGQSVEVWILDKGEGKPDWRGGPFSYSVTMFQPRLPVEKLRVMSTKYDGRVLNPGPSGGLFIDIGFQRNGYLPPSEVDERRMRPGTRLDVWVRQIREWKDVLLTLHEPKRAIDDLVIGERVTGRVVAVADFGGYFVDVGSVRSGLLGSRGIPERHMPDSDEPLKVGQDIDVWVSQKKPGGNVRLTMMEPRVELREVRIGQQLRGTIKEISSMGTMFVDVGMVCDAVIRAEDAEHYNDVLGIDGGLTQGELKIGKDVDVWVKLKRVDTVHAMLFPLKAAFPSTEPVWKPSRADRALGTSNATWNAAAEWEFAGMDVVRALPQDGGAPRP